MHAGQQIILILRFVWIEWFPMCGCYIRCATKAVLLRLSRTADILFVLRHEMYSAIIMWLYPNFVSRYCYFSPPFELSNKCFLMTCPVLCVSRIENMESFACLNSFTLDRDGSIRTRGCTLLSHVCCKPLITCILYIWLRDLSLIEICPLDNQSDNISFV